jgi:hypothetical protein
VGGLFAAGDVESILLGGETMYKRGFWIVLGVLVLLTLTTTVAWAAPVLQGEEGATTDPLWIAVTPLLAIATAIERLMERFWERWESKGEWPNANGIPNKELKTPTYIQFKRARGHWLGFGLAVVAIALTNVRLFHLLGFDVLFSGSTVLLNLGIGGIFDNFTLGTLVDWLTTALIIGFGGTELTHSVIVGLLRGRKLWEEMGEVQKGRKSILDVRFFQDEIAPRLEEMGISMPSLRLALDKLEQMGISTEQVISEMVRGRGREFLQEQEEAGKAMLTLLEGEPQAKGYEPVDVGRLLEKVAPELL